MILTGIGDEGANTIDGQIQATLELGWKYLEPRGVEVPGFAKANFHDIPDLAFDLAVRKLEAAGVGVYCFGSTIMNWSKKVGDPFEITLGEAKRAIPRMRRLGTKYIRVMSSKPKPWPKQDPWEFWEHVRDHVVHIHIKDATWNPAKNDADYDWPGEGEGRVRDILKDAFARGYDAGISIEPHMVVVFHDANSKSNDAAMQNNYVEYGQRLRKIIDQVKEELAKEQGAKRGAYPP